MATNLRLRDDVVEAVRAIARRSGRSQQEIIREAIDRYLALAAPGKQEGELDAMVGEGMVRPPRTPYRKADRRLQLPAGMTSIDILNREDRF